MNKVYGIIGAASGIVTSLFLYFYYSHELYTDRVHNLIFRLAEVIVLFISVLFAIIAVKKINGNKISFMRCMFSGFIISIIGGLVNSFFFTVFYFTRPNMLLKAETIAKEQFDKTPENKNISAKDKEKALQEIHLQFTPGGYLLPNVFGSFAICMIGGIFISAFAYTRSETSL